jgi:NodT family efflux transporter outer membrane factor (OMF) lipoprotein
MPQESDLVPAQFSAQGTITLPQRWWESLKDPELNALMKEALAGNFSIRTAWDRLRQAEALADQATAFLWPSVSYSGSARRTRTEVNNTRSYRSDFGAGVGAAYEIDLWGRARSAYAATLLDMEAQQEDVAAAAMTVSATVAKLWYQLAQTRETITVLQRQLETNQQVLELIELQFGASKVGAPDVFRQRQLVEATQGQLIQAQEQEALLQHALSVLSGRPADQPIEQTAHLIELPVLPAAGLPSEVLQRRPDVRSAWLAVQAADARVAVAITDKYPSLSLSADADTTSTRVEDLFDDWVANLAANAVGPLFDAGRRQAEVERTQAVVSQLVNQYSQTVLQALQDVEDALTQEHHQTLFLASLRTQLELAREVREKTYRRYKQGQFDYLRVLEALRSEQLLEVSELGARRLLLEHRIDLCRSIAGSWDMKRPQMASLDKT